MMGPEDSLMSALVRASESEKDYGRRIGLTGDEMFDNLSTYNMVRFDTTAKTIG